MKRKIKQIIYKILKMFSKPEKIEANEYEPRNVLAIYRKRPLSVCYVENKIEPIYDLMIIVPAYNVENSIEKCLDSVLAQKTSYNIMTFVV